MTEYIATITSLTGDIIGINPNSLRYAKNLNKFNEGSFKINGLDVLTRASITEGAIVKIYKNGTQDFEGVIDSKTQFSGGVMAVHFNGSEFQMTKENTFSVELWQNTASASIFASIVGNSSTWTTGTIDTGVNIDFRVQDSDNIWNTVGNLSNKTNQDLSLNYVAKTIGLLDHQGSQTSVVSLIYEHNIKNITFQTTYPIGNKVKVYGKGDGSSQIVSESSHGQDASSQATYGVIPHIVRDLTAISVDEANKLADSTVAYTKLPQKVYTFEVQDLTLSTKVVEGDVVTIHAPEYDLDEEEVRIVSIERGFESEEEVLIFQVTNKEYAKAQKRRNEIIGEIEKLNRDSQTYMQGTTNVLTFSQQINGTSTAPLRVQGNLPDSFIRDEAGNLRVESFTCDYDVDPFRSSVGTASETDVAPPVNGTSASTQPGVSGTSSSTQPGVSGTSGEFDNWSSVGSDGYTSISCSSGVWTTVAFVYPGSSHLNETILATIGIMGDSGGPEDIEIRLGNDSIYGYLYPGVVGSGATQWGDYSDAFRDTSMITITQIPVGSVSSSSHRIFLAIRPQSGAITLECGLWLYTIKHDHSDGSYYANNHGHSDGTYISDNHGHGDGSYTANSHNHSVSIGDDVSDAGSVNATSVNLYVDFWNGSSWVQKHSILSTGKIIDTDVDISNSGTLPDAAGFWRTRITTNNSDADLINGIIKVKHELDT